MIKKLSKKILTFILCISMFTSFSFTKTFAENEKTNDGKLILQGHVLSNDFFRTSTQYPKIKTQFGLTGSGITLNTQFKAKLQKEDGTVIKTLKASNHEDDKYVFDKLEYGRYKVEMTLEDDKYVLVSPKVMSIGRKIVPEKNIYEFEISENNKEIEIHPVFEPKAYGLTTKTKIGTFDEKIDSLTHSKLKDNNKTLVYYEGLNMIVNHQNNLWLSHNGIYYNDSANITGTNALKVPTLSDDEKNKGYEFKGWMLEGDATNKIYTEAEAVNVVANKNLVFNAVFERKKQTVRFKTDRTKGSIGENNLEEVIKNILYGDKIDSIPTVKAKEGFKFLGWFVDLTTNTIKDENILNTPVIKDLDYYAKYEEIKKENKDEGTQTPPNVSDSSTQTENNKKDEGTQTDSVKPSPKPNDSVKPNKPVNPVNPNKQNKPVTPSKNITPNKQVNPQNTTKQSNKDDETKNITKLTKLTKAKKITNKEKNTKVNKKIETSNTKTQKLPKTGHSNILLTTIGMSTSLVGIFVSFKKRNIK